MAKRMRTLLSFLLLALAIGACASMGPLFPPDAGATMPPDFDRSDCCRQD
jgi:predicted small lipoprotein YifL